MWDFVKIAVFVALCIALTGCAGASPEVREPLDESQQREPDDDLDAVKYYELGVDFMSAGRYEEALGAFERAVEIDPHFGAAHFGVYCSTHGKFPRTFWYNWTERGTTEVKYRTDDSDVSFHYALMYDPFFEWRPGTVFVEHKPSTYIPGRGALDLLWKRVHAGYKSFLFRDYEAAVKELTKALEAIPQYEQARFIRGLAYAQLRMYDAAIDDFFYILQNNGKHKKAPTLPFHVNLDELYYLIGYAFFKQGDLVNAEYFYQTVTLKNPSFYMAYVQLARVYQSKNEHKKALDQLDAALHIRPEDPILRFHKGEILAQLGEPGRALDEYKAALSLNPDYYKTHFNMAKAFDELGNREAAAHSYTAFVHRAPDREKDMIAQARARLEQLQQTK